MFYIFYLYKALGQDAAHTFCNYIRSFCGLEAVPPPTLLHHPTFYFDAGGVGGGVAPVCAYTFCYQSIIGDPSTRTVD